MGLMGQWADMSKILKKTDQIRYFLIFLRYYGSLEVEILAKIQKQVKFSIKKAC